MHPADSILLTWTSQHIWKTLRAPKFSTRHRELLSRCYLGLWGRKLPGEGLDGQGDQKGKRMRKKQEGKVDYSDECRSAWNDNWETGGILFWEHCFRRENSLSSAANSVTSVKNSVSSLWHTNKLTERNSLRLPPGTRWGPKNSLSLVFETVLSERVFGPFPKTGGDTHGCAHFFLQSRCSMNYCCLQIAQLIPQTFFCCNFPVRNYRMNPRTNSCCNLFTLFPPGQISAKSTPLCQNYRINSGRNFLRYSGGDQITELLGAKLSRDCPGFLGGLCWCVFSPPKGTTRKKNTHTHTHKQNFGTRPVPGQSRKFVYVYVFFFPWN